MISTSRGLRLFILFCCVLSSGCSQWVPWSRSSAKPVASERSVQLAEVDLAQIITKQEEVLQQLAESGLSEDDPEAIRLVRTVATQYQSFLLEYPDYLYGYLLYGKFLRQIGDYDTANLAFMQANQLSKNVAVVKQQIGNFLAEEGEYSLALPYFMSALELEPQVAIYHYQLGELLHEYRHFFVSSGKFSDETLQAQMHTAFARAAELEPGNRIYQLRYAESFFDLDSPDWQAALSLWGHLEGSSQDSSEVNVVRLQKARVLFHLNQPAEATALALQVTDSDFLASRNALLAMWDQAIPL